MKRTALIAALGGLSCTPPVRDGVKPTAIEAADTGDPVDCDAPFTAYFDADGDEWGDSRIWASVCELPPGHTQQGGDCNDLDAAVSPGAVEACNGVDDNCDGAIDEGLTTAQWFPDADGDGYGIESGAIESCLETGPPGHSTMAGDCDDLDEAAHPGANEQLNRQDSDCSGLVDDLTVDDAHHSLHDPLEDAELGSSLGGDRDLNGDGTTDLVVGMPGANAVAVYSGNAPTEDLVLAEAWAVLDGRESSVRFGHAVDFIDDLDGDGATDLAVGDPSVSAPMGGTGRVTLLLGPFDGTATSDPAVLDVYASPGEDIGATVASLGTSAAGAVQVAAAGTSKVFGGAAVLIIEAGFSGERLSASIESEIGTAASGSALGTAIVGRIDLNGDGLEDLLAGDPSGGCAPSPDAATACGTVHAFMAPFATTIAVGEADTTLYSNHPLDEFGRSLANAGDWNGDGIADVLVGSPGHSGGDGRAHALQWPLDGPTHIDAESVATVTFVGGLGSMGASVGSLGDADGDGYADAAVGAPDHDSAGGVFVFWGGSIDGTVIAESRVLGTDDHTGIGRSVHGIVSEPGGSGRQLVVSGMLKAPTDGDERPAESGSIWFFSVP